MKKLPTVHMLPKEDVEVTRCGEFVIDIELVTANWKYATCRDCLAYLKEEGYANLVELEEREEELTKTMEQLKQTLENIKSKREYWEGLLKQKICGKELEE